MAAHSVTTVDKSDVLGGLFAVWDSIAALLDGLTVIRWQTPSPLPGWNVQAVVSHLIGTESFLAGIALPQPDIDVKTLDHVRNDIGVMNECWVRHLSCESGDSVLERFRDVTNRRRKALESMSEDDWNAVTPTPVGPDSYGRFMRVRVFDCWMHEQDIRDALRQPSSDDELRGRAAELAFEEITTSMGFVVGKRAKAPDGARVLFQLTGPLARAIRVRVDGRAQVVDDFGDEDPTATIVLDGLQFTRITGGRPMSALRSQDVELGGDEDLAARIVQNLNFVV